MNTDHFFQQSIAFLHSIGLETEFQPLPEDACFLPGLLIRDGRIFIDRQQLLFAGDVLHEAGHLAVVPAAERATLDGPGIGQRKDAPAEEMMAIAWSYAACLHLDIDPAFVFHGQGYQGGGENILQNFNEGRYFGVPLLQWLGMTSAAPGAGAAYPAMEKWLRE